MRDMFNNIHPVRAISPVAAVSDNTPYVSEIIPMLGYESLTFLLLSGALADADATWAVLVEHGDQANLSDATAVPDALLLGTEALAGFTFADDNETRKIGYVGHKKYVRLTLTGTGNAGSGFFAAIALLGHPLSKPTLNPPV